MKHAVGLHRGALAGGSAHNSGGEAPKDEPPISSDPTIAFFSRQQTVLTMANEQSQKHVRHLGEDMRPLLQFSPRMTIGLLRAITAHMESGRAAAEGIQQRETMAKYLNIVPGIARTEQVKASEPAGGTNWIACASRTASSRSPVAPLAWSILS